MNHHVDSFLARFSTARAARIIMNTYGSHVNTGGMINVGKIIDQAPWSPARTRLAITSLIRDGDLRYLQLPRSEWGHDGWLTGRAPELVGRRR